MRRLVSPLPIQHALIAAALSLLAAATAGAPANPAMDPTNQIVVVGMGQTPEQVLGVERDQVVVLDQLGTRPIYLVALKSGGAPTTNPERVGPNSVVRSPEHDPASAIYNSVSAIEIPGVLKLGPDWAGKALNLEELPKTLQTSKPVIVGVLDTGVDSMHSDLNGRLVNGRDFVNSLHGDDDWSEVPPPSPPASNPFTIVDGKDFAYGHGTHVSGVIAKVAPFAKITPVRVLDNRGVGTVWTVLKGIVWAIEPAEREGAAVLNLSLGTHEKSEALRRVIQLAVCDRALLNKTPPFDQKSFDADRQRCKDKGGAFVFAGAGNERTGTLYPAAFPGLQRLTSVTATAENGGLPYYANQDSSVDIAAPGDRITSTFPGNLHATLSGTSMATPWVTGTAAQLLASQQRTDSYWTNDTAIIDQIVKTSASICGVKKLKQLYPLAAITNSRPPSTQCP
jgi:major intracellular serine protease